MQSFQYSKVATVSDALAGIASPGAMFVAGGTTLIDLMKLYVERPTSVVDINSLPLDRVEPQPDGSLKIGALVRNSDLAHNDLVQKSFPVLSQALLSGASPQLRNMAATGGNLLQRTRCYYFRDVNYPCNKRQPGSGCSAIGAYNRIHAVLGTSESCIATNPSDMAVAMMAIGATIHIASTNNSRTVPISGFYLLPGNTPNRETVLEPGEIITHVTLPPLPSAAKSYYLKRRDRSSYEFALASAAVIVETTGRRIRHAQIAFGGIATIPWRSPVAEKALIGHEANDRTFHNAAEAALRDAKPHKYNAFKIPLAKLTLIRALQTVTA